LLTTLDHPSIPTIYDYFFDERAERFYLVMKYISGGDIGARLRSSPEGRIQERVVTEWAIQVADVLDYLHNHEPPIVYRDLKPSNIMIDGNTGRIMLVDFGIARWVNKDEKGVTAVGTMGYAPPELFSGSVEPRSDIYSLGSTMFHLLTGADPQSNPLLIFNFEKNPRPRQINPQLSDQIEQILIRAVEYEALRRFSNAAEFRSALVQHLSDLKLDRVTHGIVAPRPSVSPDVAVFCGFCGQKIMASDVYCPYCGVGQPSFAQSIAPVSARKTARLVVLSTNELDSPQIVLEKDENLIGRRDPISNIFPEVDLSRFDPQTKVSRRHARIWRSDNSFMIEDLGSSNGTLILRASSDGKKLVPHQPFQLSHGDKVRLGDTTLHFVMN
jgi:serine/threonine-protein kinase